MGMEETNGSEKERKPFSVLEKFRQLKKEKEHVPTTTEEPAQAQDTTASTVFQASGSSSNEDLGRGGGYGGRGSGRFGRWRGKRGHFDNAAERPPKRIAAELWRGQKETDVGITEYIRSGPGFDIILKHRYTDFHVHEIDLDGNVVKLTSTDIPKEPEVKPTIEEFTEVLNEEEWALLKDIVEKQLPGTLDKDVTDLSKEERQRVHKAIKRKFGVYVYSNTNTVNGKKILQIGYASAKDSRVNRWPDGRPEYLHFVVCKENCDTADAVQVISKFLRAKVNKFGYAGTKDKRAVTTQQMCIRRVDMERFRSSHSWRGIVVGNFCYKWSNLRLGDLSGNRFKLALRNIKGSKEVIEKAVESLKNAGFINYFGMQRFGQSALVPTYLIGQAILKGDWKLAAELVLKPRPGEASFWDVKEAREVWWETRDANKALKCLGRREKSIEGKVLSALNRHGPNAYQNAFDAIPRHTVTLYLHSYQSLIWNKVVSRRIRQFGLKVLPGDLVTVSEGQKTGRLECKWQENLAENNSEDEDEDDESEVGSESKIQVRALSAEEAESTSIYDVVYPLPGNDIRFPDNEIAGWYKEILEADGHSMSAFDKVNVKYGMYGTYRKMLETVEDLNWNIQQYSDPDEDLLVSDFDILRGRPPLLSRPDGPYKAMIIEFNLKTCCYATMAIRELAKCETSVVNQTKLTNQAREEDVAAKRLKREEIEKMEVDSEVRSESVTESAGNNCDSTTVDEVQSEKQLDKNEVDETNCERNEVDKSSLKELGNVNCDTQGDVKNGIIKQPNNNLGEQPTSSDLVKDDININTNHQIENVHKHTET